MSRDAQSADTDGADLSSDDRSPGGVVPSTGATCLQDGPERMFTRPLLRVPIQARALLLWGLVLGSVWGCGPSEQVEAAEQLGVVLRPAETLLDRAADWELTNYPETGLPADIAISHSDVSAPGVLRVRPDEWDRGDSLPAPFRHSLELPADARVFRAVPTVGFRPGIEAPSLRHAGRSLQPWVLEGAEYLWRDDDGELIFWWDTVNSMLMAIGRWAPGHALLTQGSELVGASAHLDEGTLTASDLAHKMTVGTQTRSGLLVPAPSSLALDVAHLDGSRLHVVVAVAERVYQRDDGGRVMQKMWNQLPVRFSVIARSGGSRYELWTRTVSAEEGFVSDVVDLSSLPAGRVSLRLKTERGESTDGSWPFGFWSDLALSGQQTPLPSSGKPHVIVINVDGLRSDRLGAYGSWRGTTPRLDDWAASHATVYKDTVSASNKTLPSTVSLLSGQSVAQHGMRAYPQVLGTTTPLLSTRLRAQGYRTYATVEGGAVSAAFGFDQGFDVYDERGFQSPRWHESLDWLEQRDDDRPAFLFMQTYLVHAPWQADARFEDPLQPYAGPLMGRDVTRERVIEPYEAGRLELTDADQTYVNRLYDAAVARLDDYLVDFLERLDDVVPPGDRVVIITSDHGEELFGHGRVEHGTSLYRELLAVPLIVQYPDRPYGSVQLAPASTLDVVPTILETLKFPLAVGLPGRSLREVNDEPLPRVSQHGREAHSVQYDGWKLIVGRVAGSADRPDAVQLYDLHADPNEHEDIAQAVPEWVRRLQGMLDEYNQAHRPLGPAPVERVFDPLVVEQLRRLGVLNDS